MSNRLLSIKKLISYIDRWLKRIIVCQKFHKKQKNSNILFLIKRLNS